MEFGDMTMHVIAIAFAGFLHGAVSPYLRGIRMLLVFTALLVGVHAVTQGYYWQLLERAAPIGGSQWRPDRITPNQLAAIVILLAAFFVPSRWARSSAEREYANRPQCELKIWPKSRTAELRVRNIALAPITLHKIAILDGQRPQLLKSCNKDSVVRRNQVIISDEEIDRHQEIAYDLEANSWFGTYQCWVHGEYSSGEPWTVKAKVTTVSL